MAIASASKDGAIYTSERVLMKTPTPAILPSDRPAQQWVKPKEAKEQKETNDKSPKRSGAQLVLEPVERMSTWAEHTVKWNPINKALAPPEANQVEWRGQSDPIQSYLHIETGRHIPIDGPSGQFYDHDRQPITRGEALTHVMPEAPARSHEKHSHHLDQSTASPAIQDRESSQGISM